MTTKKVLTKEKILEALKKNKITTLDEFIEALMPGETGGYGSVIGVMGMAEEEVWLKQIKSASEEVNHDFVNDPL